LFGCTVKLVYSDHPRDPEFVAFVDRWSLYRRNFMLLNLKMGLQNGGRYSEVVVSSGLTVLRLGPIFDAASDVSNNNNRIKVLKNDWKMGILLLFWINALGRHMIPTNVLIQNSFVREIDLWFKSSEQRTTPVFPPSQSVEKQVFGGKRFFCSFDRGFTTFFSERKVITFTESKWRNWCDY